MGNTIGVKIRIPLIIRSSTRKSLGDLVDSVFEGWRRNDDDDGKDEEEEE